MKTKGYLFTAYMILSALTSLKFVVDILNRYWREALAVVGVILALGIVIFTFKACNKPEKKLEIPIERINKINSDNEQEKREGLRETVVEHQEVLITVDERTTIAEVNVEERDAEIAKKVADADAKITVVRQHKGDVTADEVKCLLGSKEYCE